MESLRQYCDEELSLRVMNDEVWYEYVKFNHWSMLVALLRMTFIFTKVQLADLRTTFDNYQEETE